MDPALAMSTEFIQNLDELPHRTSSKPDGQNVLFGDTHVRFETVKANSGTGQAYNANMWNRIKVNTMPDSGYAFRYMMSVFQQ